MAAEALAAEHGVPVLPRGAATSLAGQTVGDALVLDLSRHMSAIVELDPEARTARVQPGVVQDQLNKAAGAHGLMFGPDTSTSNRATLGGMIGNNSAGSGSIRHGMTIDHVRALDVVLADASRAVFSPVDAAEVARRATADTLEGRRYRDLPPLVDAHRGAIAAGFPDFWRRAGGYRLDRLAAFSGGLPAHPPVRRSEQARAGRHDAGGGRGDPRPGRRVRRRQLSWSTSTARPDTSATPASPATSSAWCSSRSVITHDGSLRLRDDAWPAGRRILFHGHCHQKAGTGTASTVALLTRIPGPEVVELDAGCCGMAGSFGFEAAHDVSMEVGEDRLFPPSAPSRAAPCRPPPACPAASRSRTAPNGRRSTPSSSSGPRWPSDPGEPGARPVSCPGVLELVPGANAALPGDGVTVRLDGAFDLCALVLGPDGRVGGDADFVFYNAPSTPGVTVAAGRVDVTPARLRRGADRVVVVAGPDGTRRGNPRAVLAGPDGTPFARLPALGPEPALVLAEVYPRAGGWRVRAVGQGYADGLAGLARDFGVQVDDPPGTAASPGGPVAEVVAATNAERARHGLGALVVDDRLARAAQAHSEDMVRRAFFAHQNPDGAQVWDRAVAAGYAYRKVAENIAAGQRTAAEVVRGWMDSPGHRANVLDGDLTQIGVGHAEGGGYGIHWTQVFGTPR